MPLRAELGPIPEGVELVAAPSADVEMVVLGVELVREGPELFGELPGLRVVQAVFAGVDTFVAGVPPGVVVCSASGAHDIGVAEWVVAVLLALRRRLPELLERQRHGEWDANVNESTPTGSSALGVIDDLDGSTVLILGHGSIGRAVAARLAPFGVHVVGVARHARADAEAPEALERLLPQADAVVVLLPLTQETERIVDGEFLARHKPGAVLVNAARGRSRRYGRAARDTARRSYSRGARCHRPGAAAAGPSAVEGAQRADHSAPRRRGAHLAAARLSPRGRPDPPLRRW